MNEIGLAIQCNTCQTAGVLGPFGSDMAVSYYELAVLVTYLLNDVEGWGAIHAAPTTPCIPTGVVVCKKLRHG
jgi:hypothetical protein